MDKPTLLYTAGSYGAFLLFVLNQNEITVGESYHNKAIVYRNTNENIDNHHLIDENVVGHKVIKITYQDNDISLINRNKWHKVTGHLESQASATFPNNPNKELYTMAIHVCNLLDKNNHFRAMQNNQNIEFKFEWFLQDFDSWVSTFGKTFQKMQVAMDLNLLRSQFDAFNQSQRAILQAEQNANDLISRSYSLAKKYFSKYNNQYSELYFNEIFESN